MFAQYLSRYTAFVGDRLLVRGSYADVARALALVDEPAAPVLVFDDATGAPVDAPPPPEHAAIVAHMTRASAAAPATEPAPAPTPGRPRLGVVAREITLLPRHWEWLAAQQGGASATLRRLVDQARKINEKSDGERQARERCYKFMSSIAGHRPGFEEAARALFAADGSAFAARIAHWPKDVRTHLNELAHGAFSPSSHSTVA